jgi:hypothetical protein
MSRACFFQRLGFDIDSVPMLHMYYMHYLMSIKYLNWSATGSQQPGLAHRHLLWLLALTAAEHW